MFHPSSIASFSLWFQFPSTPASDSSHHSSAQSVLITPQSIHAVKIATAHRKLLIEMWTGLHLTRFLNYSKAELMWNPAEPALLRSAVLVGGNATPQPAAAVGRSVLDTLSLLHYCGSCSEQCNNERASISGTILLRTPSRDFQLAGTPSRHHLDLPVNKTYLEQSSGVCCLFWAAFQLQKLTSVKLYGMPNLQNFNKCFYNFYFILCIFFIFDDSKC